jgi:hypothetical protein
LLGDNTGSGPVILRPIRFQCVEIWISAGLYVYTFLVDRVCTQIRYPLNYRLVPILWKVALSRRLSVTGAVVLLAVTTSRLSEYTMNITSAVQCASTARRGCSLGFVTY